MTLEQLESLQDDSTIDEEIDEDMAFNSDDEEKYGKYFSTSITVSNNLTDKNVNLPIPLQHNTVRIINVPHGHKVSLSSICLDVSKVDYQQIKLIYKCSYPANQSASINDYNMCLSNYLSMKNGGSGLQPTTPINLQVVGPCKLEFKVQIMPEKYSSGGSINIFGILLPIAEDELIDDDVFADAFMSDEDESIAENSDNNASTNSDGSDEEKDEVEKDTSKEVSWTSKKRKLEDNKKNIEAPSKKKSPVESKTPATTASTTSQPENTTEKKLTKKQRKKLAKEKAKQLEETLSASRNETTPATDEKKSKKKKKQASAELNESRWSGTRERRLNGGLIISDLILGSGAPVKPGKRISLHYTGSLRSTKQVFDKNNSKQHPLVFRQSTGEVIRGLERGLEGMKAGGERIITIPSKLGYGSKGSGASIPPDSDLVFEVKVLKVG